MTQDEQMKLVEEAQRALTNYVSEPSVENGKRYTTIKSALSLIPPALARVRELEAENERLKNPKQLPSHPMSNELTVILLPDDGFSRAEKAVEDLKSGKQTMLFDSEDGSLFHRLRLITSKDPSLLKRISVFLLKDGEYIPIGLSFEDETKWPAGFCMKLWGNETEISEVRRPALVKRQKEVGG